MTPKETPPSTAARAHDLTDAEFAELDDLLLETPEPLEPLDAVMLDGYLCGVIVQPVLLELDREVEEAAASLGANNVTIFTKVVLPALLPALLSGAGLAFSRAIGEFGSVVLIGGAVPGETEVSSHWIRTLIENDDRTGAAAISIVLLVASFVVLFVLRAVGSRAAKREELAS